jgi:hypothetical protein
MPNTKEWLENNKDKTKMYKKKYRDANGDKIKEYNKKYCEENADKIKEYRSQIITCECGCEITRHYLTRHLKNDTHKNRMQKSVQVSL